MTQPHLRHPGEVAERLDVSPATLRRWSRRFAAYLSEAAQAGGEGETGSHRRYTEGDLQVLVTIKGLLSEGYTYAQVDRRLAALYLKPGEQGRPLAVTLRPAEGGEAFPPAVAVLAETLHVVSDGQQLLLGSQQANRDLLGLVVQDNFNLKEENVRLRERMLHLERELSELRRVEADRRAHLEERVTALEDAVQFREEEKEAARPGCLGRLLGL
ncbi:MAG: MerR family transcriptional regulator [Anaerolineae bacterium]